MPNAYYSFGSSIIGSKRYRCRACGKTFSIKAENIDPVVRQKLSDKNLLIFDLLFNKMPQRRICKVAGVTPPVLYERIDFSHEQALSLLAHYESKPPETYIKRLYIGVDRQEYAINWTRKKDKKNVILSAVASADNLTGYVFGMHTNFDPDIDSALVEKVLLATGEDSLPAPFRKCARLWLQIDYNEALLASNQRMASGSIESAIANEYEHASARNDIESSEVMDNEKALPYYGMLVHSEYTPYGHFFRLDRLLKKAQ